MSGHEIQVRVREGVLTGAQLSALGSVLLKPKLKESGAASCVMVRISCVCCLLRRLRYGEFS